MYKATLVFADDVLKATREAARKAPAKVYQGVNVSLKAKVEAAVQQKVAPYPGPAVHPFIFATPKSRRWYMWQARKGNIPSTGRRYKRSGAMGKAWVVKVDRRTNEDFISILNRHRAAGYVYGSGVVGGTYRQVPGHARTGWGRNLDTDFIEISEMIEDELITLWFEVMDE